MKVTNKNPQRLWNITGDIEITCIEALYSKNSEHYFPYNYWWNIHPFSHVLCNLKLFRTKQNRKKPITKTKFVEQSWPTNLKHRYCCQMCQSYSHIGAFMPWWYLHKYCDLSRKTPGISWKIFNTCKIWLSKLDPRHVLS